jgi:hypothetical protein
MVLIIACVMPAQIPAADSVEPKFPELPKDSDPSSPVMQLAVVPDHVAFGKPVDFYIRFINCGIAPVELTLNCVAVADIEPKIQFGLAEGKNQTAAGVLRGSLDFPLAYLAPGESVVVKMGNQLVTPGKHKIKACHYHLKKKLLSNAVDLAMADQPLNDQEIKGLLDDCEQMLTKLESKPDKNCDLGLLRIRLAYYNPYTIPLIKKYMEKSPSSDVRLLMSQTLGCIANPESARDRGFHRDTSSKQFILDQLKSETDSRVKADIILNTEFFFDSFDDPQKKMLKEQMLSLLENKDQLLRYWAGINMIDLFPDKIPVVEEQLNRPGGFGPYDISVKSRIKQMEKFRNAGPGPGDNK